MTLNGVEPGTVNGQNVGVWASTCQVSPSMYCQTNRAPIYATFAKSWCSGFTARGNNNRGTYDIQVWYCNLSTSFSSIIIKFCSWRLTDALIDMSTFSKVSSIHANIRFRTAGIVTFLNLLVLKSCYDFPSWTWKSQRFDLLNSSR
jgi:hypothetical protein